jgi:hypothetical protein
MDTCIKTESMKKAVTLIEKFVETKCSERPPSHNHLHMFKVRDNSRYILTKMVGLYYLIVFLFSLIMYGTCIFNIGIALLFNTICCIFIAFNFGALSFMVDLIALLHDVADHKYVEDDPTLAVELNNFLSQITSNDEYKSIVQETVFYNLFNPIAIINIIERISFSRQNKYGTNNWYSLLGLWGVLIRNIVSDADKLEAIGKDGIDRCRDFTIESFSNQQIDYTQEMVRDNIIKHYHEKLKLVASYGYMRTLPGWLCAQFLDKEMREYMETF